MPARLPCHPEAGAPGHHPHHSEPHGGHLLPGGCPGCPAHGAAAREDCRDCKAAEGYRGIDRGCAEHDCSDPTTCGQILTHVWQILSIMGADSFIVLVLDHARIMRWVCRCDYTCCVLHKSYSTDHGMSALRGVLNLTVRFDECMCNAGNTQQSAQRKGRMERRHQQLRSKQRARPEITSAEAARARSRSSASNAFIPEGGETTPFGASALLGCPCISHCRRLICTAG